MRKLLLAGLAVAMTAMVGCDKKDNNPTSPGGTAPTIPVIQIQTSIPDTTTNPYAQSARSQVAATNAYFSFGSIFNSMQATNSGNTWTWTYTAGGLTETFTATKQGDGSYTWKLTMNGSDGSHTYSNYTLYEGASSADGKSGNWAIYSYGDTTYVKFQWSTDASGVLTGTMDDMNGSTVANRMVITSRPDKSGQIVWYQATSTMQEKWVWLTTGHGSFYTYPTPGDANPVGTW